MKRFLLGILLFIVFNNLFAQSNSDSLIAKDEFSLISKKSLALVGVSSIFLTTLVDSYFMWWENHNEFKFLSHSKSENWLNNSSLGIDKVGHFYTSYFFYHTNKNILKWAGYSDKTAFWISTSLTSGLALLIEVGDGFSQYSFDYQDLVFNMAGLGYGILQDQMPFFQNFNFKWSFIPTDKLKFPPRFTEHYDSHIYLLSIDLHNLLGEKYKKFWPEFICPAVGFSTANNTTRREYIIGLDFNFLFDKKDENWKLADNIIQLIHFPAPGIKYTQKKKPKSHLFLLN
ncbi:MAG: DUF2279 domain-containing protein [Bacteroidota bacterium]